VSCAARITPHGEVVACEVPASQDGAVQAGRAESGDVCAKADGLKVEGGDCARHRRHRARPADGHVWLELVEDIGAAVPPHVGNLSGRHARGTSREGGGARKG